MVEKHTPGSLYLSGFGLYVGSPETESYGDSPIASAPFFRNGDDVWRINASHLVACWNACEGINPKAVPGLLKATQGARAALTQVKIHPADIAAALSFLDDAIAKTETGG